MFKKLFLVKQYFIYLAKAKNAHSIHSPFVFDFINNVLNDTRNFYAFETINNYRKHLVENKKTIQVQDFGAGSLHINSNSRAIAEIAKNAGKNKRSGELLFRIVNYFQPKNILELGTSLGIGTMYLSLPNSNANIVTIEGSKTVADEAKNMFDIYKIKNIKNIVGNFNDILEPTLINNESFDLVYIDGNHQYTPTINYYNILKKQAKENCVFIFDDIHWSKEMQNAWDEIVADKNATLTLDLFQFGLVFFNKDFKQKQHFILRT